MQKKKKRLKHPVSNRAPLTNEKNVSRSRLLGAHQPEQATPIIGLLAQVTRAHE